MKKAKIMLSAIAVNALIDGALAFKAQKFGRAIYLTCNTVPIPNTCVATTTHGSPNSLTTVFDPSLVTLTTAGGIDPTQSGQQCSANNCLATVYYDNGL